MITYEKAASTAQLADDLEAKARAIVLGMDSEIWEPSPRSLIARELALTLEEMDKLRTLHESVELDILNSECGIETGVEHSQNPTDKVRLQAQLRGLQVEKRKLAVAKREQLQVLHRSLLESFNKYGYLANGP